MRRLTLLMVALMLVANASRAHSPTWTDGIACIIYSHCTSCHRPQGIAPFSLMSYNDVYANRLSIAASVQAKSMPPFTPSQEKQKYAHANTLSQHEIDEIVEWVDNFAPLGNANDVPPEPVYSSQYELQNPDKIIKIPSYTVNTAHDLYRCFVIPLQNNQSEYITQIELVPNNREIVHHAVLYVDTSSTPLTLDAQDPDPGYNSFGGTGSSESVLKWIYTPGQGMYSFPTGMGTEITPQTYAVIQMHYPGGTYGQVDSSEIRIKYSSQMVRNLQTIPIFLHSNLSSGPLVIPPNQIKTITEQLTTPFSSTITSVLPHMHLLGKSMDCFAVSPLGDTTVLFDIPDWDFHWQGLHQFQKPIMIPANSTLYASATYDNTANNPDNPNSPPQTVYAGEATADEMFVIVVNATVYMPGDTNIIIDTASHFTHDASSCEITDVELSSPPELLVYPNPTRDFIRIKNSAVEHYKIYNLQSKLIADQKLQATQIDLRDLHPGVYFLQLTDKAGNSHYQKITKQ